MASQDLPINRSITIPGSDLSEQFITAGGPGGQHVNKVATAVQLRFDAVQSMALSERVRDRLLELAGRRASKDGVILIEASRFRTQDRNRQDARDRLRDLILEAAAPPPPPRKKTKPSRGAVERRLQAKAGRSTIKKMRGRVSE
jgi:ribosome-associated protein